MKRLEKRGTDEAGSGMLLAYTELVQSAFYEQEPISEGERSLAP